MEIVVILDSWNYSGFGDQKKGDSITLGILRDLAERGYPLAEAKIFLGNWEYIALVNKGKFVFLKPSQIYGEFSEGNIRWILRGYYGKAFRYSEILKVSKLSRFYDLDLKVFRGKEDVVLYFSSPSNSRVFLNLVGGKTATGYLSVSVFNLFSTLGKFEVLGQFDTLRFYSEFSGDISENIYLPFGVFLEGNLGKDGIFYLFGIHRWYNLLNFGLGFGEFGGSFGVLRLISVDPSFEGKILMGFGEVGFEGRFRFWNLRMRAFKGFRNLKKPYGGFDGYREVSPLNSLENKFFTLNLELPLYSKTVKFGPFFDALIARDRDCTFGIFLNYGNLRMFLSRRGFFGVSLGIER
ncbi:hypothetical protein LM594_03500 [Candidatus Caldipriscus sp.]|nr:hypothetical protein [Candidatus Caldipriscus sp.]